MEWWCDKEDTHTSSERHRAGIIIKCACKSKERNGDSRAILLPSSSRGSVYQYIALRIYHFLIQKNWHCRTTNHWCFLNHIYIYMYVSGRQLSNVDDHCLDTFSFYFKYFIYIIPNADNGHKYYLGLSQKSSSTYDFIEQNIKCFKIYTKQ